LHPISQLLTERDQAANVRVLREAKERQINVSGDFDDLGEMLKRIRGSDEWHRIRAQESLQSGPNVG